MRTLVFGIFVLALLTAGTIGSWIAMNHANPGSVGTPVHAGALSNGHPEDCTNLNFSVPSRGETQRTVSLQKGTVLRGTFEVHGGFGRVDVLMRILSPQGVELYAPPKTATLDFSVPARIGGDYIFVFDNRYSLFTAKSVALFYCMDTGRPFAPGQGSGPSSPPLP
jgi:hypothetical protein